MSNQTKKVTKRSTQPLLPPKFLILALLVVIMTIPAALLDYIYFHRLGTVFDILTIICGIAGSIGIVIQLKHI